MVVGDIIRRTATLYPQKVGVVFQDRRFTWKEVNARVNSLANALLKLGLKKGQRVSILSRNCNEYIEYFFALAKAGLIGVPLNWRLKPKELAFLTTEGGVDAMLVHHEFVDTAKAMSSEVEIKHYIGFGGEHPYLLDLETLIKETPSYEPEVKVKEEDIFTLAYTSGSTGRPKGAIVTHKNSVFGTNIMVLEQGVMPYDNYLPAAQFCYNSSHVTRLAGVLRGCKVIIVNFEAEATLKTIEQEKITIAQLGPTMLQRMLSQPNIGRYNLSSLRCNLAVGVPISANLWEKLREFIGLDKIVHAYALAESSGSGIFLYGKELLDEDRDKVRRRMSSVGKPSPYTDVRVIDEEGKDVAANNQQVGEIIMRSESMVQGYWNLPEDTADTFKERWMYTGDLATVDEEFYIHIVGRKKDLIKSGGLLISPAELEEVIAGHPAVFDVAVIGVPHKEWGETPHAIIVPKEGAKITEEEIIELCKQKLASYKKPSSIEFVESLPLSASGKVLRKELKDQYQKKHVMG